MPAAFVQAKSNSGAEGTTTIAVTFDSNVVAGNTIVLSWFNDNQTNNLDTVTDNLGNSYAAIDGLNSNLTDGGSQYAANIVGGSCTVTVTFTGTAGFRGVIAHEISGVSTTPLDVNPAQAQLTPGTGTDAVTSGGDTPSVDGCYIFGATWTTDGATGHSITQGTGFTARQTITDAPNFIKAMSEDQVQAVAASIAATFTISVAHSMMTFMVALKPTTVVIAPIPATPLVGNLRW